MYLHKIIENASEAEFNDVGIIDGKTFKPNCSVSDILKWRQKMIIYFAKMAKNSCS